MHTTNKFKEERKKKKKKTMKKNWVRNSIDVAVNTFKPCSFFYSALLCLFKFVYSVNKSHSICQFMSSIDDFMVGILNVIS